MKRIAFALSTITSFACPAQITWYQSNLGIPAGYQPVDMTLSSNGDVYMICRYHDSTTTADLGKIMKSNDEGSSWTEVQSTMPANQPFGITATNSRLISTGFHNNNFDLYSSTDNGKNWTKMNTAISNWDLIEDILWTSTSKLYVLSKATMGGGIRLFTSLDEGGIWSEVTVNGLDNYTPKAMCFAAGKLFMLAEKTALGLFYSTDDGKNWTQTGSYLSPSFKSPRLTSSSLGEMYLTATSFNILQLYKSVDLGTSWVQIPTTGAFDLDPWSILQTNGTLLILGLSRNSSKVNVFRNAPPVGLAENALNHKHLFPSPAKTHISIKSDEIKSIEISYVDIISISGQLLMHCTSGFEHINIEGIAPGIYQVRVGTASTVCMGRFIKE